MKSELSCAVAQSLMPLSVDGATDNETEAALQAHLTGCENCRAIYESMKADADAAPVRVDEAVLFKKTKRKLQLRTLGIVLVVAVLFAGAWIFSLWYNSDSVLNVNEYDVCVEKVPKENFLLVDAGGGDYLAHLRQEPDVGETQFHKPFLLRKADFEKLQSKGYAWYVSFGAIGRKQIDDISNLSVRDGKLSVVLWSYHDTSLFGRTRDRDTDALIYDDFTDVVNEADEKPQPNVTWVLEPVETKPGPG